MSLVFPIDRAYKITQQDHGNIGEFGPAGASDAGTWLFDFVPDASFTGAIAVVGRGLSASSATSSVGHVLLPYRAGYLNGAVPVQPYGYASDPITGRSLIQVPGGFSIALLISCTAGFGWLYSSPILGSSGI